MEIFKCSRCGCDTTNKKDYYRDDGSLMFTSHRCDACERRMDLEYDFQCEGETIDEFELICPWCQSSYDSYDAYKYDDGETEVECMYCGKHFDLEIETRRRYSTKRSICDMPEDYGQEEDAEYD